MKLAINKSVIGKTLALALLGAVMQSCFVAKKYTRPELKETENLYRTNELPQDSLSMADVSWKDLFTDPYLEQYIVEGLENNMDIRIAMQQMAAADAYMKQGKAGYFPSFGVQASVSHQELSQNSQFGSFFNGGISQYEFSGNLSWEADIWGKIRSTKRASEASYLQSVAAHQAVKTRLVASIAATYYRLLALDAQLGITSETVETRRKSVETIQALKDAGQVNQVAVDQNIAQYNQAKALEVDIRTSIFTTENAFNLLLGLPSGSVARDILGQQELDFDLQLGVPSLLLRNRPDVMAAEFGLVNAFEMTNVARSGFYPSLTLTATGGFQSLELDKWLDTNSLFASLLGGLTQPIFQQRKIRTQYEVAQAQQEQALLNFKKTLLVAGQDVSNALRSIEAETEKSLYRLEEAEALRRAETNSEFLLINGYGTYLDLLTAQQGALNAQLNVVDNQLQQLLSVVSLYEALGGGWR